MSQSSARIPESHILYEDNHLLGLLKPAGLLVQGDRSGDVTLLELARHYIREKYAKPGNVFLGLVHRLDRPVSGVVIVARTSKAASRLTAEFRARRAKKTYLAVVRGQVRESTGQLVGHIERTHLRSRLGDGSKPGAKEAALTYRVLARQSAATLLEVSPSTGRHHQIRLQLADAGHPVVGDIKYGARVPLEDRSIALHAERLIIQHPVRDVEVVLHASPLLTHPWSLFTATIAGRCE